MSVDNEKSGSDGQPPRRRAERQEVNHDFGSVNEFLSEYAMNLSSGGVFIRSAEVLPVGTRVRLKFSVIVDDFETIEGEGEVTRAVHPDESDTPGMGVVFTELTPKSRELLAQLFTKGG